MSTPPPAPATSSVTRYILIAVTLVALAVLMWKLAAVFVLAFGGVVFATVLQALAEPLSRRTGLSQRVSLGVVVLALVVLGGITFWLFGRQAVSQFAEMREQLPAAVEKLTGWIAESRLGQGLIESFKQAAEEGNPLSSAGLALGATLGGVGHLLLILFVGIYLAADPVMYRDGALRLLPPARRPQVRTALNDAGSDLRKWLLAQLIIMAAVGVMTGLGLGIIGVPLALSLGLVAGLLEFIPVVGPIVAAIPGVLLAFSAGPQTALYTIGLYIVVQQIESNILTPLVQRWAVELPPVVALLSIVAAGLLFGVMGVIFATPMAVVVLAMVRHLYVEDTLEKKAPKPDRARLRATDSLDGRPPSAAG